MPKSKVRKRKNGQRVDKKAQNSSGEYTVNVPVWEYGIPIGQLAAHGDMTEEEAFRFMMALPIRMWNSEGTRVATVPSPIEMAREAGVSLDEWYESECAAAEMGLMGWDAKNKAHYMAVDGVPIWESRVQLEEIASNDEANEELKARGWISMRDEIEEGDWWRWQPSGGEGEEVNPTIIVCNQKGFEVQFADYSDTKYKDMRIRKYPDLISLLAEIEEIEAYRFVP